MALLFYSEDDDAAAWRKEITRLVPDLEWRTWPEIGDRAAIDSALVWLPPPGLLAGLPGLQAVFYLAAGIDSALRDATLPDVPVCRMVDASLTRTMSEFVLVQVLKYHRLLDRFAAQQCQARWRLSLPPGPSARTVGIMGMGVLGSDAARVLGRHGFRVKGWSRSVKLLEDVTTFDGADGLAPFLADLDVLVCLLPLTAETEGILNARTFAMLPKGARVINVARGPHLVETDLIDALDSGHLAHASLDVTGVEPLPSGHAFWRHPLVDLTPHAASYTRPESGAVLVAENLRRLRAGLPLLHVVDRARGY